MLYNDQEFRRIVNASDEAVISIRGHVAIESALSELIAHALPSAHEVELERVSFPLKIDLAIGLRAIHPESRQLFLTLNKVRNRFAHKATAILEEKDLAEIKNSMSAFHRKIVGEHFESTKTPRDALRIGTVAAFYEAKAAADHLLTRKIEKEEMLKEIEVLLEETKAYKHHPASGKFSAKVQARVKQRLAQLEGLNQQAPKKPNH